MVQCGVEIIIHADYLHASLQWSIRSGHCSSSTSTYVFVAPQANVAVYDDASRKTCSKRSNAIGMTHCSMPTRAPGAVACGGG